MTVISVNLAHERYDEFGVVALKHSEGAISVVPIRLSSLGLSGTPGVAELGSFLAAFADELSATSIVVDSPQGWKAPDNGRAYSRACERELDTPGRVGLPGETSPAEYHDCVAFSIALFDRLNDLSFPRLATTGGWPTRVAIESFPTAAWRSLGLAPLPAKSKASGADVAGALESLRSCFTLDVRGYLTREELQATVAGVAGIALERRNTAGLAFAGVEPYLVENTWREGYIVSPTREAGSSDRNLV